MNTPLPATLLPQLLHLLLSLLVKKEFPPAAGVEDRLQEGVASTLTALGR